MRRAAAALGVGECTIVQRRERENEPPAGIELPLLGPSGVLATLVCTSQAPLTRECERELVIIAMHLSAWWTNRGVDTPAQDDALTPRQLEIALLATNGLTNAEIAHELAISINTVKVRLKQVFDRLDVNNRTELANVLRRSTRAQRKRAASRSSGQR